MNFLRKLFAGSGIGGDVPVAEAERQDYNGFTIIATPYKADGQWQLSGIVMLNEGGVVREHKFVRADKFSDRDQAVEFTFIKGRLIVDQLGKSIFG